MILHRLLACLAILACAPLVAFAAETKPAKKPVIAVFSLAGEMAEQPADEMLTLLGSPGPSLRDVVTRMKKAADDPDVKAVVVLAEGAQMGFAQTEELRQAMQKVRAGAKDVFAHSDSMLMGQYVVLSGASRLSVAPTGDLFVLGLHGDALYLHGLLAKLGIEADFLHCGAYKSATEMFTRDGPSPQADEMTNWLLDSMFDTLVKEIAQGRKVQPNTVRDWIDGGMHVAEKAKALGMIDAVESRAGFEAMLKEKFGADVVFEKRYGLPKPPQLDLNNPFSLIGTFAELMGAKKVAKDHKPAVGVVYVDGLILLGKSESSPLDGSSGAAMSTDITQALDAAARDDSIKAVVLRIDSQGGSAVASDIILEATRRLKATKPFVVSMGNIAGSGGYYVACAADTIFADESTLTGSIGVLGGKFVTTRMWNSIGVTWKSYQRGASAGLLSTDSAFSDAERKRMQAWLDDIYGVFKKHVTDVRGDRLKKPIDDLAGGRVYTGRQALELGLVDRIGTLSDSIAYVADQAKLKDYDVRTVPEPKNIFELLMEQTGGGGGDDPQHLATGPTVARSDRAERLLKLAAPYLKELDPQHARAVIAALRQLALVQSDGAAMVMGVGSFGQ
jgi:protease-4